MFYNLIIFLAQYLLLFSLNGRRQDLLTSIPILEQHPCLRIRNKDCWGYYILSILRSSSCRVNYLPALPQVSNACHLIDTQFRALRRSIPLMDPICLLSLIISPLLLPRLHRRVLDMCRHIVFDRSHLIVLEARIARLTTRRENRYRLVQSVFRGLALSWRPFFLTFENNSVYLTAVLEMIKRKSTGWPRILAIEKGKWAQLLILGLLAYSVKMRQSWVPFLPS